MQGDAARKERGATIKNSDRPVRNPNVMLREEFDDWAILFNPDSGHGFGLNPTGVCLWKLLDGGYSIDLLFEEIHRHAEEVSEQARDHIGAFIEALVAQGLAGPDSSSFGCGMAADRERFSLSAHVNEATPFTYEPPQLVDFRGEMAYGACCSPGTHQQSGCGGGALTSGSCGDGSCANAACGTGSGTSGSCNCTGNSAPGTCDAGSSPGYSTCDTCCGGYMNFFFCSPGACCAGGPSGSGYYPCNPGCTP